MADNKEEIEYSFRKNGITKEYRVQEVENGYILSVNTRGYKKNKKGEKEWFEDNKRYITSELSPATESIDSNMATLIKSLEDLL